MSWLDDSIYDEMTGPRNPRAYTRRFRPHEHEEMDVLVMLEVYAAEQIAPFNVEAHKALAEADRKAAREAQQHSGNGAGRYLTYTDDRLKGCVERNKTWLDVSNCLGISPNHNKRLRERVEGLGLSTEHFPGVRRPRKEQAA